MPKPTDPGQSEDAHTAPGKSEDAPGHNKDEAATKPVDPDEPVADNDLPGGDRVIVDNELPPTPEPK